MSDNSLPLSEAERNRRILAAFRILASAAKRKQAQQAGSTPPADRS